MKNNRRLQEHDTMQFDPDSSRGATAASAADADARSASVTAVASIARPPKPGAPRTRDIAARTLPICDAVRQKSETVDQKSKEKCSPSGERCL